MAYSLSLQYGVSSQIYLDGSGITAPVKGSRYSPGRGKVGFFAGLETITEEIKIDLAGSYRQISDFISLLNLQLETFKAGAWHDGTTGPLVLRFVEPDQAGAYYWFARVFDARLELDAGGLAQRKIGGQLITLWITRQNHWESSDTNTMLLINFPGGGTQITYGGLMNHKDATAGHSNWGWINPSAMDGDLLSDTVFQLQPDTGDYIGDIYVGLGWSDVPEPNIQYALPTIEESAFSAGSGVTKTSHADAACSGGNYAGFAWSATAETLIAKATVPATLYSYSLSRERPFKPMARLQAAWAVSDLWLKVRVLLGGTSVAVYESEWFLYPGSTQLIEFPPVYLPPAGVEENVQLDIAIYASKTSAAAYTMNLDYLQLWPVDGGFRKYKPVNYFSTDGQLIDGGFWGSVYWANLAATQKRASVLAYGPTLRVLPGRTIVLAIANLTSGTTWLIDDRITTVLSQVPTKRNI